MPVFGSWMGAQFPEGQPQIPSKHDSPGGQALPQAPQWSLLQQVATQVSPQRISPSGQQSPLGQSQIPSKQVKPGGQTLPQAPQLALSQQVSTQSPPHSAWPGAQPTARQAPPAQTPLGQAFWQAPQWRGSVARSRQRSTAPQ
jgi:hypothetical protein